MESSTKEHNKTNLKPGNEFEKLQNRFEMLCNEQEALPKKGFKGVFEVLDEIDETFTIEHPYTNNEDNINKALEMTGHSDDDDFCKAFKRNNQIIIEGKEVQAMGLATIAKEQMETMKPEPQHDGWQFYPIKIFSSPPLSSMIENIIKADANEGKGLFQNITDIPTEDEELDKYLMIDAFGMKCSLKPYLDELKRFEVVGKFLSNELTKLLLAALRRSVEFIKENTDAPAKVQNYITKKIVLFDDKPIEGLFFQILILQGIRRWIEGININEGDNGYYEAQSLYDWLTDQLMKKEIDFCYKPYGEGDIERLKPLCNYLYSTELGKMVQSSMFKTKETDKSDIQPDKPNPRKLNFASYLEHNNKPKLIEFLRNKFPKGEGKEAAVMTMALSKLGFINIPTNLSELVRVIAKEWNIEITGVDGFSARYRELERGSYKNDLAAAINEIRSFDDC